MFSVLLWTFLLGALGAFLGVPIAIATLTMYEHRWVAEIFSGQSSKESKAVETPTGGEAVGAGGSEQSNAGLSC